MLDSNMIVVDFVRDYDVYVAIKRCGHEIYHQPCSFVSAALLPCCSSAAVACLSNPDKLNQKIQKQISVLIRQWWDCHNPRLNIKVRAQWSQLFKL